MYSLLTIPVADTNLLAMYEFEMTSRNSKGHFRFYIFLCSHKTTYRIAPFILKVLNRQIHGDRLVVV